MQWKGARKPTPTKPDSYRFQQKSLQLQALFFIQFTLPLFLSP